MRKVQAIIEMSSVGGGSIGLSPNGRGNLTNRQEHSDWLRSITQGPADQPHWCESEGSIKVDRIRFRIHDYPDAADTISHLKGKLQHGSQ